jgi:uncharacterized membrane protein
MLGIENIMLIIWLIATFVLLGGVFYCAFCLLRPQDPIDSQLDYYCKCFARGELSKEDFKELKRDLMRYRNEIEDEESEESTISRSI